MADISVLTRAPSGQTGADEELNPRRVLPDGMHASLWHAADGWPLRRLDRPAASPRGSLLFLGGRGDFLEKYLEVFEHWHRAGWSFTGLDWRGQGGSGRHLDDRLICHMPDFDRLVDDAAAFVTEWRAATPGPHVAVAHSMGAHLLLRLLAERKVPLDAAVLASPMIGIGTGPFPAWFPPFAARLAVRTGLAERPVWRGDPGNARGRLTSCPDRHADKLWWKAVHPEVASGSPSWGWLAAAYASIARLTPALLAQVDTPLLLLVSRDDGIIDIPAARAAAQALPHAELIELTGGGHELLREADAIRLPVLAAIDDFLDRGIKPV